MVECSPLKTLVCSFIFTKGYFFLSLKFKRIIFLSRILFWIFRYSNSSPFHIIFLQFPKYSNSFHENPNWIHKKRSHNMYSFGLLFDPKPVMRIQIWDMLHAYVNSYWQYDCALRPSVRSANNWRLFDVYCCSVASGNSSLMMLVEIPVGAFNNHNNNHFVREEECEYNQ